jgi:hypothetical protein
VLSGQVSASIRVGSGAGTRGVGTVSLTRGALWILATFFIAVSVALGVGWLWMAAPGLMWCVPLAALCWRAREMSWESEWEASIS